MGCTAFTSSARASDRRYRRKDALLQENGYFVLRYLAEDVGKHLDSVLDGILRWLTHRRESKHHKSQEVTP